MSIFSQLPNRLIMDIIKMADGGLHTHKQQISKVHDELSQEFEDFGLPIPADMYCYLSHIHESVGGDNSSWDALN